MLKLMCVFSNLAVCVEEGGGACRCCWGCAQKRAAQHIPGVVCSQWSGTQLKKCFMLASY
jgi:hypothetical protein